MISTITSEHQYFGKSRMVYPADSAPKPSRKSLPDFRQQRIEQLNAAVNNKGEIDCVILHPFLERSSQNIFTIFISAMLYSWEKDLKQSFFTAENRGKIADLLRSQQQENGLWSFFSRQPYQLDWDDTSVARKCLSPAQAFDPSPLLATFNNQQLIETWVNEVPDSFLMGDTDLCVNLNVVDYLLYTGVLTNMPVSVKSWCEKVLEADGLIYFSTYYQSFPFLLYQLSKLFFHYPIHQHCYPKLYALLKEKLCVDELIYSNYLSYLFLQLAKSYSKVLDRPSDVINTMYVFLQSNSYYLPAPFFYGPGGWYGSSAVSDFLTLEFLYLNNQ